MSRLIALSLLAAACTSNGDGVAALGQSSHDESAVSIRVIADSGSGLDQPSDIAFNPMSPDRMYVTNYGDNSITVMTGADFTDVETPTSPGANHFLVSPMSLAFSDFGNFATIHDTDELTQGNATPRDFMGPVLWDDSDSYDGGHGGHLDMLHNSPLGGGIAWEEDNTYWVFDGFNESLTRYAFNDDHGYGGADHTDGQIVRYVEGEVQRIEGIPSHVDLDRGAGLLYVADTANGRLRVLDIDTGERGGRIGPNYDGAEMFEMDDATIFTLTEGDALESALDDRGREVTELTTLEEPAGLQLWEDLVFVTDNATSRVLAFDLDGLLVDWVELDRPAGSLGGVAVDAEGRVYVTDLLADEVIRLSAAE